jgi:uncharacterized damage-inducible protein DinB
MSPVPKWFTREFDFRFPVEFCPNLCARLRGTPARLDELLHGCPRELLVRRPQDKWSAQEHAGHLLDLEPLWMARVEDYLTGATELTTADLSNRNTDEADHNVRPLEQITAGFRNARTQLVDRVEKIDAAIFARVMIHPRLKKPMRLVDHIYFVAEHDDHHLAQIWQLISAA